MKYFVSQIGCREYYGTARAMHSRGALRHLYTDIWCRYASNRLQKSAYKPLSGLGRRYHSDLAADCVSAFTFSEAFLQFTSKKPRDRNDMSLGHIQIGRRFATQVAQSMRGVQLNPEEDCFFGYNTGCLETLQDLKSKGIFTIVDQVDAAKAGEALLLEECELFPGWGGMPGKIAPAFWERIEAEWALADLIVVNSQWSRTAIMNQGVPPEKIVVVPLAYEPTSETKTAAPRSRSERLEVLFLGKVNLGKGIQYLIQAARLLLEENIQIRVAGPINIAKQIVEQAPLNMVFLGKKLPEEQYQTSDVFVLPTLSDGFALTQLEAMAYGLPVITTPNCGNVATPGHDGSIVPIRDPAQLAAAILALHKDRSLLDEMSRNARETARKFTLNRYGEEIHTHVEKAFRSKPR